MVDLPASANNSFNFDLIKLFSAFKVDIFFMQLLLLIF